MITDKELDAGLAAAARAADADMPPMPPEFLALLGTDAGLAAATPEEPASVVAARQLAAEARSSIRRRPRPVRRNLVRAGAVALVAAAAVTTLVLVDGSDGNRTPSADPGSSTSESPTTPLDPSGGLKLVSAEEVTFPYSLDPAPAGLTPHFVRSGGTRGGYQAGDPVQPLQLGARYDSATDEGFNIDFYETDPRIATPGGAVRVPVYSEQDVVERTTVTIDGTPAEYVRAELAVPRCSPVPLTRDDGTEYTPCITGSTELTWTRDDGSFVWIQPVGDRWVTEDALVGLAESIVDRPQPARLQLGLAPEGWEVSSYGDGAVTFVTPDDPANPLNQISVSLLSGYSGPQDPVALAGLDSFAVGPVEPVTVQGAPAGLVSTPAGNFAMDDPAPLLRWNLIGTFPDGTLFQISAPHTLSRDDVLAMANSVTYAP